MSDALETVSRWEASGGIWRVLDRTGGELEIVLLTCTAGEEMGRVYSREPDLLAYVGDRTTSELA